MDRKEEKNVVVINGQHRGRRNERRRRKEEGQRKEGKKESLEKVNQRLQGRDSNKHRWWGREAKERVRDKNNRRKQRREDKKNKDWTRKTKGWNSKKETREAEVGRAHRAWEAETGGRGRGALRGRDDEGSREWRKAASEWPEGTRESEGEEQMRKKSKLGGELDQEEERLRKSNSTELGREAKYS